MREDKNKREKILKRNKEQVQQTKNSYKHDR